MTLTRKHFIHIAATIAECDPDIRPNLAEQFADFCAEHNPLFDRERFIEACGVDT